ncbi:MsnO8 family LLM class oxidoreductase, partial [Peribacillus sp. NPDC060186]
MSNIQIPVSVLNLAPIRKGQGAKEAIDAMVDLAQATEKMGYKRYWVAEHHNTPTLVSSATSILIKHILEHTEHIRVGSGGIMLPNHSPLVVAEQFGTMATIYPNRLDLGLGRAPGTDMMTASALRRSQNDSVYTFPKDV